jgi:hypothetical protein
MSAHGLRLVDTESGRLYEGLAVIATKEDVIAGLTRDLHGWMARYRELERDKMADGRKSKWWPVAIALFDHWKVVCKHPRSGWTLDRWLLIKPFLELDKYGPQLCERSIAGVAFDPYTKPMLNGKTKRFDDWSNAFGSAKSFENAVNRAPLDWTPVVTTDEQLAIFVEGVTDG